VLGFKLVFELVIGYLCFGNSGVLGLLEDEMKAIMFIVMLSLFYIHSQSFYTCWYFDILIYIS
jgi:hypothetical protein